MNNINLIVFKKHEIPSSHKLKQYLQKLPLHICELDTNNLLGRTSKNNADINLVIGANTLFNEPESRVQLQHFLLENSHRINLCLLPHGESLDDEIGPLFNDCLLWPCSNSEFTAYITRQLQICHQLSYENQQLLAEFSELNLIGKSPLFVKNVQMIKKISSCHAVVLIQGETGTGKENTARAIHYLGKRREQSFVPVNCAAIPDNLIESVLFGHEKGAFTDAKKSQEGLVSLANGGTLFLDEVDSLSPKAQAVLLRFLQTREYRPLGARQTQQVDVRILAATNADLPQLVGEKLFRQDLYFRLNVLNLTIPPLRKRSEDIPLLAKNLLHRFALEYQTETKQITHHNMQQLMQLSWPGNIRELENCLLRSFLLSPGTYLEFTDLSHSLQQSTDINETCEQHALTHIYTSPSTTPISFQDAKAIAITEFESRYLQQVMRITHGNVSAAARIAGKERRALGKLLQKYAIDKTHFQTLNA